MKQDRLKPSSFFATTQQIEQWLMHLTRLLVALVTVITVLVWCV